MRAVLTRKKTICQKEKGAAQYFLLLQCIVTMILSVVMGAWQGYSAAQSTFLGGLLVIVPNVILGVALFARAGSRSTQQTLKACYIGEALKVLTCVALLLLLLHIFNLIFAALLLGLIGTTAVYWIAPLWLRGV